MFKTFDTVKNKDTGEDINVDGYVIEPTDKHKEISIIKHVVCDETKELRVNIHVRDSVTGGISLNEDLSLEDIRNMRDVFNDVLKDKIVNTDILNEALALCIEKKPEINKDGNQWCFLLGKDLHDGIAGFGSTRTEALLDWHLNYNKKENLI